MATETAPLAIAAAVLLSLRVIAALLVLLAYYLVCRVCTLLVEEERDGGEGEREGYVRLQGWRRDTVSPRLFAVHLCSPSSSLTPASEGIGEGELVARRIRGDLPIAEMAEQVVDLMTRAARILLDATSMTSSIASPRGCSRCWVDLAGRRNGACKPIGNSPSTAATSSALTPVAESCSSKSTSGLSLDHEPEPEHEHGSPAVRSYLQPLHPRPP